MLLKKISKTWCSVVQKKAPTTKSFSLVCWCISKIALANNKPNQKFDIDMSFDLLCLHMPYLWGACGQHTCPHLLGRPFHWEWIYLKGGCQHCPWPRAGCYALGSFDRLVKSHGREVRDGLSEVIGTCWALACSAVSHLSARSSKVVYPCSPSFAWAIHGICLLVKRTWNALESLSTSSLSASGISAGGLAGGGIRSHLSGLSVQMLGQWGWVFTILGLIQSWAKMSNGHFGSTFQTYALQSQTQCKNQMYVSVKKCQFT